MAKSYPIELLDDRIAVLPDEAEAKSPGGILIPDNAKKKPQRGVVVGIGPGKLTEDGLGVTGMLCKVGDVVLYTAWSGEEVEIAEDKLRIMRESDVLAKLTEKGGK